MNNQNTVISMLFTALTLAACGDDGGTADASSGTNPSSTSDPTTGDPTTTSASSETTPTGDATDTTSASSDTTTTGVATDTTSDSDTSTSDTSTGSPAETTTIRVVHLSPGSPAVDIFANGDGSAPVVDALALLNSKTLTVPAGEYEFAISADGSPIEGAVFSVPKLAYDAGKTYTVVAVGKLADDSFDIVRIENDAEGLAAGKLRLQVTHAASAAPFAEVDVWAGPDADSLAALIENFKFKSSNTADVGPDDLTIGLDIDNDAKPDAIWAISGASLAPAVGAVVNVFAYSDDKDKPSLQVVAFDGLAIQLDPV